MKIKYLALVNIYQQIKFCEVMTVCLFYVTTFLIYASLPIQCHTLSAQRNFNEKQNKYKITPVAPKMKVDSPK